MAKKKKKRLWAVKSSVTALLEYIYQKKTNIEANMKQYYVKIAFISLSSKLSYLLEQTPLVSWEELQRRAMSVCIDFQYRVMTTGQCYLFSGKRLRISFNCSKNPSSKSLKTKKIKFHMSKRSNGDSSTINAERQTDKQTHDHTPISFIKHHIFY